MCIFFFPFFEFPREYPRDCPGGPRPCPSLGLGSGPRESAVYPPKTQVYLLRMRPRELKCSHMDENSSWSTNIRALRVRVRVTGALGLGLQGPHNNLTHFYNTSSPLWRHDHTPMMSWPLWRHQKHLKFDWQVTWPSAARWLVHLYHVTYMRLSDWSVP